MALQNNHALKAAVAEELGREAAHRAARKDLYPTLSLTYHYTRQFDPQTTFFPYEAKKDTFTYGIGVEQPIYKGKSLITAVELNSLGLDAAKVLVEKRESDLVFQVHNSYYTLLKAIKMKEEAEKSLERLRSHLKDAKTFFDAGLIPKNDYLQSEVELAQGEQNALLAENQLLLAQSSLNILLGSAPDAVITVLDDVEIQPMEPAPWEDHRAEAVSNRPEMRQSDIAIMEAEKNITMAKAAYLPSVSVSAAFQKQGNDPLAEEYSLGPTEAKTAQAKASWNFWSWNQERDKESEAKQQVRAREDQKRQLHDDITLEVREAYLNVIQSWKNIPVTRKAIVQAEENYRINEARYQSQLNTSTDVLDAESLLLSAKVRYFNAIYDYRIALARLDWAKGTIDDQVQQ